MCIRDRWYVLDRSSTVSFVTFEQYADRMDAIARVFPVFFFLVAALVATTTMTRMVDENRLQPVSYTHLKTPWSILWSLRTFANIIRPAV